MLANQIAAIDAAPRSEILNDQMVTTRKVCDHFGITSMTLWRWLQDDKIGFPQPIRIGRRTYWSASAIAEFKAKAATGTRLSPASGEAVA